MPNSNTDYDSQVAILERKLRGIKRNITGVLLSGKNALEDPEKEDIFESHLAAAESNWDKFQYVWDERDALTLLVKDDDFPSSQWLSCYDSLKWEIIEARSILLSIGKRRAKASALDRAQSAADISQVANNLTLSAAVKAHLPKIPLPQFSGDLVKWSHFKSTYVSLVHHEPTLSNVEKFHYLLGAVKGEAASLISRIPIDDVSYTQAWNKLIEVYDRPRVLASMYIQRILDCDTSKTSRSEFQRYEEFLTQVADSVEGFKALKLADPAEFILATLSLRALDTETRKLFEIKYSSSKEALKVDDVMDFVRQRVCAIKLSKDFGTAEKNHVRQDSRSRFPRRDSHKYSSVNFHTSDCSSKQLTNKGRGKQTQRNRNSSSSEGVASNQQSSSKVVCPLCEGCHALSYCMRFCHLPIEERSQFIDGWKGCHNCLRDGHKAAQCNSKWVCRFCKQKHHSLIHREKKEVAVKTSSSTTPANAPSCSKTEHFIGFGSSPSSRSSRSNLVLGTVQLLVKGQNYSLIPARAVLDSGSQNTFLSRSLADRISANIHDFGGQITGLGGTQLSSPYGSVPCSLRPFNSSEEFKTDAVVVETISPRLPSVAIVEEVVNNLSHLPLADHGFHTPGQVDLLIGIDLYPHIIKGAPYHSGIDDLFLQPTVFGLVVMGKTSGQQSSSRIALFNESKQQIENCLKAFWELEEPFTVDRQHPDDKFCEEHFLSTHSRTEDGRYMVRLPRARDTEQLGNNRHLVTKRFCNLEQKFRRDKDLGVKYKEFIDEYIDLGHMTLASTTSPHLIPHHAVWQERPEGRKLRVVFDASCPSSKKSLNEKLLSGPKLQSDLSSILIQFRLFAIPLCADIVKMYRQILVHPEDRHLQHILWRADPAEAIEEYELNTITYGVKPSAFLALRVIQQLIVDEGADYPLAVSRIRTSIYVDDIVTGADTIKEAITLQKELCALFSKGGFPLSKWASTRPELIPDSHSPVKSVVIRHQDSENVKILGLSWNPSDDTFSYSAIRPPSQGVTKRMMLSAIARVFDPLGLLAPSILYMKILLQDVWKSKIDWDDKLPLDISEKWSAIAEDWNVLSSITVPRYISSVGAKYMLVGFCDASTKGYAASVYLRVEEPNSNIHVSLIKSKSKVAPVKFVSIARLELCGALLLTRLLSSISIPALKIRDPVCFTDSSVVLAWLRTPAHALKVFEANRVHQILTSFDISCWKHIRSENNPCDIASRGCLPSQLKSDKLWWNGPSWITEPLLSWPTVPTDLNLSCTLMTKVRDNLPDEWMTRCSSYQRVVNIMARLIRVAKHARSRSSPLAGSINAAEFLEAQERCVYITQRYYLPKEIFSSQEYIPKEYRSLSPFIDERGIVRVGGRLTEAPISFSAKHPMLIPRTSPLSRLIVEDIHCRHFHSGATLTLSLLRTQFWIPGALRLIKGCITRCVPCRIRKARPSNQIMSSLPKTRFSQHRAFAEAGVDYAGPFLIKESNRRNAVISKAYLCLFVCMSTKAVHIEAVSSLSMVSFLATMDIFFARRGLPKCIWSDHGTNFVGASRFLKDVFKFLHKHEEDIVRKFGPRGIEWKFIPPRSPHFGGLWEAGIKSAKSLLASVMGKQPMTFEELATAFIKVEGLLNSRPLCALNEDPEDCNFLTPGHFIIGSPILTLPDEFDGAQSRLSRWNLVLSQVEAVWNRWRKEYLHSLQMRNKWAKRGVELKEGDLVIMTEKRQIVGQWPVARIVQCHPGKDGTVRTVVVRTPCGKEFMRPVVSLVPLFSED